MSALAGSRFVEANEDELKTLAEALVESKGTAVASAGAALLVKVVTGSSVAAGAAQKAAEVFGQWLADIPDTLLRQAAEACRTEDKARKRLQQFADTVQPLIEFGLRSVEASLTRLEAGQQRAETHAVARADDFEALFIQSLRTTAPMQSELTEIKALVVQVLKRIEEQAPVYPRHGHCPTAQSLCSPARRPLLPRASSTSS